MSSIKDSPFGDSSESPFSDPSIQQAARSSAAVTGIDDFNPFADNSRRTAQPVRGATYPPVVQTPPSQPASHLETAATMNPTTKIINNEDLLRRQEELERKAEEIRRREEELNLHSTNVYGLTLLLNVVGALALLISSGDGTLFGLSILQCVLFTPCSFVLWFRPLYKAFRNDSSFNFMVFFFVMFLQLIFILIQTLGISSFGTCGWINTLTNIGQHLGAGLIMLLVAASFTFCGVSMIMLLFRVHNLYRSSGASLAKAQQEFSRGVMGNEHVQQAAAQAASAAVRTQMPGGGGPRY